MTDGPTRSPYSGRSDQAVRPNARRLSGARWLNRESASQRAVELQHLLRDHAQMWQRSRTVATFMVARIPGLYVPNVETGRLLRDERGWFRLAG